MTAIRFEDEWDQPAPALVEETTTELPVADPPVAAREQSRGGLIITAAVVLVVLVCAGLILDVRAQGEPTATAAGYPSASASASAGSRGPLANPTRPAVVGTSEVDDPSVVVPGQCVVNDGTSQNARIRAVACGPGAYLIVARFDNTNDVRRCEKVPGYTHDYSYQTTPSSLDFVLCLKKK